MKVRIFRTLGMLLLMMMSAFGQDIALPVSDYRIGPKDLLEIKIFELPERNQTVRVSEDGSISHSLLGRVEVAGLTARELERKLEAMLDEKYTTAAQVTVFIKEFQKVAVIGAVGRPGMYELIGPTSLLTMIAQAQGLTPQATSELFIYRKGPDGRQVRISVNLEDLMLSGQQDLDVELRPNDVITVPIDQILSVYIYGEVKTPGVITFQSSKRITLLQAIAQAGGTTDWARKSSVVIRRKDKQSGRETRIPVNLRALESGRMADIVLEEGDVVIIP